MPAIAYPFVEALVGARSRPGSRTLDVGCGAGQYRAAAKGSYIGLDVPTLYYGLPPDVFADAVAMPFADATIDLAFGVASFYNIADAAQAFRECRRVLQPTGSLLVVGYQPAVARRHQRRSPLHQHTWSLDELRTELEAAGFVDVVDRSAEAAEAVGGSVARRLAHHLRRPLGRGRTWLIVEATP